MVENALERKKRKGAISTFHVHRDHQLFLPPFYASTLRSSFLLPLVRRVAGLLFGNVSRWKRTRLEVEFLESLPSAPELDRAKRYIRGKDVATETEIRNRGEKLR